VHLPFIALDLIHVTRQESLRILEEDNHPFTHSARHRATLFKMAALDPKVASVVDRATRDDDSDEDALIAALEEDDSDLNAFREQRLQQLHAEFDKARRLKANEHGTYTEIKDEKALMDITTSTKLCVVHFFKPDFNRCRIMDTHLEVRFTCCSTRNELT
jgi:hypothetical protein